MKHILFVLCLVVFSTSVFAEKIVIKGEPLILEKRGEIYIVPGTYKVQDYQYVIIDGQRRACFLDKRPDFVNIDVVSINVQVNSTETATWNCYAVDPSYFVIQP